MNTVTATMPDQTHKRAAARAERLESAQALLEQMPGVAYRFANNTQRTVLSIHGNCESLTGHAQKALSKNNFAWSELTHGDDRDFVNSELQLSLAAGEAFDMQYRIVDKSGDEKWVRDRGRGVVDDTGKCTAVQGYIDDISPLRTAAPGTQATSARVSSLLSQMDDITAYAKSQIEIGRQREQLAHADRLYTLGEMATGIAHEINQPLAAISLFAQAGNRLLEAREYENLPEIFDKLSQHAHRAGTIVERIQNLARRNDHGRKVADLNALTRDVVDLAEVDAQTSHIDVDLKCAPEPLKVNVDVVQIQQVTLNLIRNAVDAMRALDYSHGNTIQVRVEELEDGFFQVSVSDSGGGVDQAVAESLFDPFLTTKQAGLGMGLPISMAIITAHGGKLHFWNNTSKGATFAFSLPPSPDNRASNG
ncbi:MAG: ATP-binding protein [Pseudomonadales bacterium]